MAIDGTPGGGGMGPWGGGGGFAGPQLSPFISGQAPGFGGFAQTPDWAGGFRRRMFPGATQGGQKAAPWMPQLGGAQPTGFDMAGFVNALRQAMQAGQSGPLGRPGASPLPRFDPFGAPAGGPLGRQAAFSGGIQQDSGIGEQPAPQAPVLPARSQNTQALTGLPPWVGRPGGTYPGTSLPPALTPGSGVGGRGYTPQWDDEAFYGHIRDLLKGASGAGVFNPTPPEALLEGVRGRAVRDAQARERAARLGLQARGDVDPSTYGFQALQSQLRGQQQASQEVGAAEMGLRQQQQEQLWNLMNQYLRGIGAMRAASAAGQGGGTDWGSILGGVGRLIGGL